MPKKIIFTVTSDIVFDQRMDRICGSLKSNGFDVVIVCRQFYKKELPEKNYSVVRWRNIFRAGKLFYLEHNLKLLFYLVFAKCDAICSIDLDTILPGFIAAKVRGKKFVYDAHEYFPEQAQVIERPFTYKMWTFIERTIVPKVKYAYTVNNSLAKIFKELYGTHFEVITNAAPYYKSLNKELEEGKYLIYTGWVDPNRGLENLIEAAPQLKLPLRICGDGSILQKLKDRVVELGIEDKVTFTGMLTFEELMQQIEGAYLGFLLAERLGKSYEYALGNKFFEYTQGGIPHISVNFLEYQLMDEIYNVARLIPDIEVNTIVETTNELIDEKELYTRLKANVRKAKEELCWEKEEAHLVNFYEGVFK